MFAVIKTGGKQYRLSKDDLVIVETIPGEPGEVIALDNVLMIGEEGKEPTVGAPRVEKAAVFAEIIEQSRADKIIVFKKRRRQNYRRKNGHRQEQTVLRVLEVSPTGTKPKAKSAAKKAKAPAEAKPAAKKPAAKKAKAPAEAKPAAKKPAAKAKKASDDAKPAAKETATKKPAAKKTAAKKSKE